jgi:hypothetical protein
MVVAFGAFKITRMLFKRTRSELFTGGMGKPCVFFPRSAAFGPSSS